MKRKVFLVLLVVGLLAIAGVVFAVNSQIGTRPAEDRDGSFIYNGIKLGTTEHADWDGDWISDRLEFWEYGTDPLKIDTDEDGIDDFNEIFTYPHLLDPLDPTDSEEFIAMLPNVEAAVWMGESGDTIDPQGWVDFGEKYVGVAKRDPLVWWYAERTTIVWSDINHTEGFLTVNGEPFCQGWERAESSSPSYYLTHGRRGTCGQDTFALYAILELMGYDCWALTIKDPITIGPTVAHALVEAEIEGRAYAVDCNWIGPIEVYSNQIIMQRDDL